MSDATPTPGCGCGAVLRTTAPGAWILGVQARANVLIISEKFCGISGFLPVCP